MDITTPGWSHGRVKTRRVPLIGCVLALACGSDPDGTEPGGTEADATGSSSSAADPTTGSADQDTGTESGPGDTTTSADSTSDDATTAPGDSSDSSGGGDPARTCDGTDYLLCLDFEDTPVGEIPEGWVRNGELVGVQDDYAHLGDHSLRIDAQPNWRRRIEHDASMIGPAHWGRVFYRVQLPIPVADLVHSTHVSFVGVGPNIGEAEYRYFDTVKAGSDATGIEDRISYIFNVQPDGPEFGQGTGWLEQYYEDTWHCVEWHVDATDQSFTFWDNGVEMFTFTNGPGNFNESEIPDSYSIVTLGWTNYQDAPPGYVAWYDDFALDDERIGCE